MSEGRRERMEKVFFFHYRKIRGMYCDHVIDCCIVYIHHSLFMSKKYFSGLICMCVSAVQDVYSVPPA